MLPFSHLGHFRSSQPMGVARAVTMTADKVLESWRASPSSRVLRGGGCQVLVLLDTHPLPLRSPFLCSQAAGRGQGDGGPNEIAFRTLRRGDSYVIWGLRKRSEPARHILFPFQSQTVHRKRMFCPPGTPNPSTLQGQAPRDEWGPGRGQPCHSRCGGQGHAALGSSPHCSWSPASDLQRSSCGN